MGKFEILFKDENFLVINKKAGLQVHPDMKNRGDTLTDYIVKLYPEIKEVGESRMRPGVVHRLDKDTEGLLVMARNNETFFHLKDEFKNRKVEKRYLALVHGKFKNQTGKIDQEIGRSLKDTNLRTTGSYAKDKKGALTFYKVLEDFKLIISKSKHFDYSLLEVLIKTGRTHQIRVHLKSIGHPIVGDKVYKFKRLYVPNDFKRMFLIAYLLRFNDIENNRRIFELELGENYSDLVDFLKNN